MKYEIKSLNLDLYGKAQRKCIKHTDNFIQIHYFVRYILGLMITNNVFALVKVFRINPEFRILRLTFHRKSASKC